MAAELAASIVAAASTLHEHHTERKIVRVREGFVRGGEALAQAQSNGMPKFEDIPRELKAIWHEQKEFEFGGETFERGETVQVPLAKMLAEGWTIEREIKPAADVSYLVLARTAPRPRPGPPAGGV